MKSNNNGQLTIALSQALSRVKTSSFTDCEITSCTLDPKRSTKNGLFVCAETDAEAALAAIRDATNAGASVAVASSALESALSSRSDVLKGVQTVFVEDPREAYGNAVLLRNRGRSCGSGNARRIDRIARRLRR